jgi:hypothetical protein
MKKIYVGKKEKEGKDDRRKEKNDNKENNR